MGTLSVIINLLHQYITRNGHILGTHSLPVKRNCVNLHYWHYAANTDAENLGDYLSKVVVEHVAHQNDLALDTPLKNTHHLYAIGSILQAGFQNACVWGSGFIADPFNSRFRSMLLSKPFRKLDVRAVRGPKTRDALQKLGHNCPEIYGDPAILMPLIYTPANSEKTQSVCILRHYLDATENSHAICMQTKDYQTVIDTICHSELAISSSLHGLILAEVYGVPAVLYLPQALRTDLDLFKFEDYYTGTGRTDFPIATTIEEALHATPCPLPDFTNQQKQLLQVFPFDLWQ